MMATLATSQKHWSTPFHLKLFYPWIVRLSFWKRGRGTKRLPTCFPTPFQAFEQSNWNLSELHARTTTYSLLTLRVRCIYNLHTRTFKEQEQSMDSPPDHKAPNACIYFTLQSYGCYVAKSKNQFTFELWFWAMLDFINNHHQF